MATQRQLSKELLDAIEKSIEGFGRGLPSIERNALRDVMNAMRKLDTINGNLKSSVANLRRLSTIKRTLERVIRTTAYKKLTRQFTAIYDDINRIQKKQFRNIQGRFRTPAIIAALRKSAIITTRESLAGAGLQRQVIEKAAAIVDTSIRGRASFSDLADDMREFLVETEKSAGALTRYTHQITTDALNQYAANYTLEVGADLGTEWFLYVGSLVKDSRPFCVALVGVGYVHISELARVANANIPTVGPVSTQGMIAGTDEGSILIVRGGWNCNHQFIPVATEAVPKEHLARIAA